MKTLLGKITFLLIISLLILMGMSTIVKAEDTTFTLNETEKSIDLNSKGYLSYTNKPTRRNYYMDK